VNYEGDPLRIRRLEQRLVPAEGSLRQSVAHILRKTRGAPMRGDRRALRGTTSATDTPYARQTSQHRRDPADWAAALARAGSPRNQRGRRKIAADNSN
jgi:hypothetical protein